MLTAKNVREWYAFYGGEELGVDFDKVCLIWDAAFKCFQENKDSNESKKESEVKYVDICPHCVGLKGSVMYANLHRWCSYCGRRLIPKTDKDLQLKIHKLMNIIRDNYEKDYHEALQVIDCLLQKNGVI